jgi:hypothetical protein
MIEELKMKGGLPQGIRRVFSTRTGKITFEVVAGVVRGQKIRKQFGESKYGSQDAALEAAKRWYAIKREEFESRRLRDSKLEADGLVAVTEHISKSIERLEAAIKASEQRILEYFEAQKREPLRNIARLAWLFSLSVEQGKDPMDVFEDLLTAGLKEQK